MTRRWRCSWYQRLLVDYADNVVAGSRKRRLEAHLRGCASCAADLVALRTLPTQLRQCSVPARSEESWEAQRRSIANAIRQLPAHHPRQTWLAALRWQPAVTAIASLLLAVGVYRFSVPGKVSIAPPLPDASDVLSLDNSTLDHLIDVMATFTLQDDYLRHSSVDEEAGSPWVAGARPDNSEPPERLQLNGLDDEELDGLAALVGSS